MNRRYSALAVSALAMGTVALTAANASAMLPDPAADTLSKTQQQSAGSWPDEAVGYPGWTDGAGEYNYTEYKFDKSAGEYNYPEYKFDSPVQATADDDTVAQAFKASGAALGGGCVAVAGMWLYRRRHVPAG
ncbi:MAG TPA: hypothetical protein VGJ44_08180 [Kribbellaceae bacterium]